MNKLSENKDSISDVKTKINDLTTASRRNNREPPKDCSGVVKLVETFTKKLKKNPKADVSSEYEDINGVQMTDGACIDSKLKLKSYVGELDTITIIITNEIKTLQVQIKGKWN